MFFHHILTGFHMSFLLFSTVQLCLFILPPLSFTAHENSLNAHKKRVLSNKNWTRQLFQQSKVLSKALKGWMFWKRAVFFFFPNKNEEYICCSVKDLLPHSNNKDGHMESVENLFNNFVIICWTAYICLIRNKMILSALFHFILLNKTTLIL